MNRFIIWLLLVVGIQLSAFAQGPLSPPGAPAPTMKTLQQVEPRIAITNTSAVTISSSGSYYLTTNITVSTGSAITIVASQVTLDLNGFTVTGTGTALTGINLGSLPQDITILNGHINGGYTYSGGNYTGSGFANGITYDGVGNVRVIGVTVSGVSSYGIGLGSGNSTVVDSCTVNTAGSYGIEAGTVSHSTAYLCGLTGIDAYNTASDSYGYCTGGGDAVYSWNTVINCWGYSIGYNGIAAGGTAENCYGVSSNNAGSGVSAATVQNCYGVNYANGYGVFANANAINCYGVSTTGTGLSAGEGAENCYGYTGGSGGGGLIAGANAINCYGYSTGAGDGLLANTATGCLGRSSTGIGLLASTANNCFGLSSNAFGLEAVSAVGCFAASTASDAIHVEGTAQSCYGSSGATVSPNSGVYALTAQNCYGVNTAGGYGMYISQIAIGCYGISSNGTGLFAPIANSCAGSGTPNYTVPNKYNMP